MPNITRMQDFTLTELFGWFITMPLDGGMWDMPLPCNECGAAVFKPEVHRQFHNKLLP